MITKCIILICMLGYFIPAVNIGILLMYLEGGNYYYEKLWTIISFVVLNILSTIFLVFFVRHAKDSRIWTVFLCFIGLTGLLYPYITLAIWLSNNMIRSIYFLKLWILVVAAIDTVLCGIAVYCVHRIKAKQQKEVLLQYQRINKCFSKS
jgi:hypothetical protein